MKPTKPPPQSPTGRMTLLGPAWQDLPLTPQAKAFRDSLVSPEERARRERVFASLAKVDYAEIEHRMLHDFRNMRKK